MEAHLLFVHLYLSTGNSICQTDVATQTGQDLFERVDRGRPRTFEPHGLDEPQESQLDLIHDLSIGCYTLLDLYILRHHDQHGACQPTLLIVAPFLHSLLRMLEMRVAEEALSDTMQVEANSALLRRMEP